MNAFRIPLTSLLLLMLGCGGSAPESIGPPTKPTADGPRKAISEYGIKVVNTYPHDPKAFTQGLVFENGFLYESTGLEGKSSLRKVELATGKVLHKVDLDPQLFGEGMAIWKDEIVQLTWKNNIGLVYDKATFQPRREFPYPEEGWGEGWGLTNNAEQLILSNGTSKLWFLDPKSYKTIRDLEVKANGHPVLDLNELEWVDGEIYANIWGKDVIARIDPHSGQVVGWIDLAGLYGAGQGRGQDDVLNGIAYDAKGRRLFVTGKNWPQLYEIRLVPK